MGTDVDDVGTDVDDVGTQTCVFRQGRTLHPLLWELEAELSSHPPALVVWSSLAPPGGTLHRADWRGRGEGHNVLNDGEAVMQ